MTVLLRGRELGRTFRQRGTRLFERSATTLALDDADIDIRAGAAVGIIGESGSGKSTLVRILLGLDAPTTGTVTFDGNPNPVDDGYIDPAAPDITDAFAQAALAQDAHIYIVEQNQMPTDKSVAALFRYAE